MILKVRIVSVHLMLKDDITIFMNSGILWSIIGQEFMYLTYHLRKLLEIKILDLWWKGGIILKDFSCNCQKLII